MTANRTDSAPVITALHADGYVRTPGRTTSSGVAVTGARTVAFLAGQVANTPDGGFVGQDDLAAQLEQVYRNIEALAEAAGSDMGGVISLRAYLVGQADLDVYRVTKAELSRAYWPDGRFPANTMVVVNRLAEVEYLVEIEAVLAC